jgi:hypothetical protein
MGRHAPPGPSLTATPLVWLGRALSHEPLPEGAPWAAIADAARAARLEPLLLKRRRAELPGHLLERLETQTRRVAFAAVIAERECRAIVAALSHAGVQPVVLLKGAVLGHLVYPDPVLRSTNDLDLLVQSDQLALACDAATTIGYQPTDLFPNRPASGVAYHERLLSREVVPGRVRQPIELHTGFAQPFRHRLAMQELLDRSLPFIAGGAPAHRLDDEDMLLHLAVHLAREQFLSPGKHLYDVHLWVTRGVRWPEVLGRAKRYHVETALFETLRLARDVFRTDVPTHVFDELGPWLPRRLWLEFWHTPTDAGLVRRRLTMRTAQALTMLPLLDTARDRTRAVLGYARLRLADLSATW